jgi:hypothetical protein
MVLDRLKAYNDDIALWHILWLAIGLDMGQREVSVARVYLQTMLQNIFIIAMLQEAHRASCVCRTASVEPANGSHSYY